MKTTLSIALSVAFPLALAGAASAQLAFTPNGTLATGADPDSIASGDFDGDGDLDLAVANGDSNFVSIFAGLGDGTFAAALTPFISGQASGIVAADLDGDGDLDLATANGNNNNCSVLLNNGGAFAQSSTAPAGDKPRHIATLDLDGDGDLDLLIVNGDGNNMSVLNNNGAGAFTPGATLATGADPRHVSTGDLDGDGDADAAVANHDSNTVTLFINNAGVLTAQPTLAIARPNAVIMADVDGDLDLDLVVSRGNAPFALIVLRNDGGLVFTPAGAFPTAADPQQIVAFDGDLDGDLDLATACSDGNVVSVLQNVGGGAFGPASNLPAGQRTSGITAGDFDGDADADLAASNSDAATLSLYRNDAAPLSSFTTYGAGCTGSNGVPALSGTGFAAAGNTVTISLANGVPSGVAILVFGFSQASQPLPGGCTLLLVPAPGLVLPLDAAGAVSIPATVPAGLPSGGTVFFQGFTLDAGAPNHQYAASNGLQLLLP